MPLLSQLTSTLAILSLLAMAACDRSAPEPPVADAPAATGTPAAKPAAVTAEEKTPVVVSGDFQLAAAGRVVAIGDLHGDMAATERAFRLAGAIDEKGSWIGGELVVVQTGDQLDRGDDESKILRFLERLQKEAKAAGGAVHVMSGNHETMNVLGDFRYVTPKGLSDFDGWEPASPLSSQAPPAYRSRAAAFLPAGGAAIHLSSQPVILMVGKTAFAHGGILPAHVDYGIDKLNRETRDWMRGRTAKVPPLIVDSEGPVWTRLYGPAELGKKACDVLGETLAKLGAERMVIGHTVQQRGLTPACDNRVFRIDVGLAHYYGDRAVQVLEVQNGEAKILTEK